MYAMCLRVNLCTHQMCGWCLVAVRNRGLDSSTTELGVAVACLVVARDPGPLQGQQAGSRLQS